MRLLTLFAALSVACDPAGRDPADAAATPAGRDSGDAGATLAAAPASSAPPAPSTSSSVSVLARYDFSRRLRHVDLPGRLDEISGLAFSPEGRLFAHDDERGRIHEVDPLSGEVGKRFDLGTALVRDDFEGIAIVGERFFLVASTGWLYETREGDDEEQMEYRVTDTGVGATCEVEGLDHDPEHDELLVACKVAAPDRREIVIHRVPVQPGVARPPAVRIPKALLGAHGLAPEFDPSGIAVTPTGSWLLVSGRHHAVIEVTRDGEVLAAVDLRDGRHPQAEGIALGPDGTLYISDEKSGRDARLTAYGPR